MRFNRNKLRWSIFLLLCAAFLAAAGVVYCHDPAQTRWFPECVFYHLTGLYCPGCGATRALHALVHGEWAAAFRSNVLLIPLAAAMVCFYWRPDWGATRTATFLTLGGVLLFWVLRNIPAAPFTWLAPL